MMGLEGTEMVTTAGAASRVLNEMELGLDPDRGLVHGVPVLNKGIVLSDTHLTLRTGNRRNRTERSAHMIDVPSIRVATTGRSLRALGWSVLLFPLGLALSVAGVTHQLTAAVSRLVNDSETAVVVVGSESGLITAQLEQSMALMGSALVAVAALALTYYLISAKARIDVVIMGELVTVPLNRSKIAAAESFAPLFSARRREIIGSLTIG